MDNDKVFIAGGTGFVGLRVVKAIAKKGYKIKLLSKSGYTGDLPSGTEIIEGDITLPEKWRKAASGCVAFINLIGIIKEYPAKGITFEKLHIKATENVVDICKESKITRIIQMSACGASPVGVSEYQTSKYEGEEIVRESGLNYTIFRPSLIFGPGDDFINKFAKIIKDYSFFPIFGDGEYKLQPVYVEDLAEAFAKSIDNTASFGTFCIGGPEIYSYKSLIKKIAEALNDKVYTPQIPIGLVKKVVSVMKRFKNFPITPDQLEMLLEGNVCEESKIFKKLDINRTNLEIYLKERFDRK